MAILKIEKYPSQILKTKTKPVSDFKDPTLHKLIKDMEETLYAAPGIGLAANQVGVSLKLAVIDVDYRDEKKEKNVRIFINPTIIEKSDPFTFEEEGCLSLPGITASTKRFKKVTVEYQDLQGNRHTLNAQDLLAICLQHETDHLNGKLYVDHLSFLKRDLLLKKFKNLSQKNL